MKKKIAKISSTVFATVRALVFDTDAATVSLCWTQYIY